MTERRKSKVKREDFVRKTFERTLARAARKVEGVLKEPGEAGFNPDGFATWHEMPARTRIAHELMKGYQAAQRSKQEEGPRQVLAVVMLPQRIESAEKWESFAAEVDRPAIEAVVVEKEPAK